MMKVINEKMRIIKTVKEIKSELRNLSRKQIGFVPTMGSLHKGHISLIEKSLAENNITFVSIFVNPTQFDNAEDLEKYPNQLKSDIKILEDLKIDYLYLPTYKELYADNYKYKIMEDDLSKILCGAYREGHFTGVLTVVMKLLNIVKPTKAYFGEKDYQQYLLVKGMAEAFFLDVEIINCPIIRDEDGLALSSRNVRLTNEERQKAKLFPELLKSSLSNEEIIYKLNDNGFKVDYIETKFGRRFGAVYLGKVRLIDNVEK